MLPAPLAVKSDRQKLVWASVSLNRPAEEDAHLLIGLDVRIMKIVVWFWT